MSTCDSLKSPHIEYLGNVDALVVDSIERKASNNLYNSRHMDAAAGRAIADHLAAQPIQDYESLVTEFLDEDILTVEPEEEEEVPWVMYFDEAMNQAGKGEGGILVSPDVVCIPISVRLNFECSNNIAEYEACIAGMKAALEISVKRLEVYGDSLLIVNQPRKIWKIKDEKMIPCHEYLIELTKTVDHITFHHLYRDKNQFANTLTVLASLIPIPEGSIVKPIEVVQRKKPAFCYRIEIEVEALNGRPWYQDIKRLQAACYSQAYQQRIARSFN